MINVTVKTLDSQNHQFSVDDEITVRQFKEHIAEKVNVEADLQRIIYCGRLLKDEKFLREYDVNGKVVHLVQRAPPSTIPTTSTTESPPQNRWRVRNLNARSPLIRAIDGMVLGGMAIPMSASNGAPQATAPSLNPSSTLCMNRITVARHMLECANNIARFLENPEGRSRPQGLNNAAMEDLAQQSLESTVFEVGISAVGEMDIPQVQMQNLMHAFQGAVSAALRQNGVPNIRVMQPGAQQPSGAERPTEAAPTVQIVEGSPGENATASRPPPSSTTETPTSQGSPSAEGGSGQRTRQQTTRTQVLATVVQQMRDVQARLEPFVQQYYDILQNDPTYESQEERNNAQRVFDHVSEAFHYISHAQHAISDLMLCLSSSTPRHLCCRPILVEQSAFVSSEFTVPFPIQANLANVTRPNGNNNETATGAAAPENAAGENNNAANRQSEAERQSGGDGPVLHQGVPLIPSAEQSNENRVPRASGNQELQIARIIQAVVNTAPVDADLQVEINPPQSSASTSNQQSTATTTASTSNATIAPNEWTINVHLGDIGLGNVLGGGGANQPPRVTTVTLPTTSTQTRSTARQQMHTANIPTAQMRNFRPTSGNLFSVFDRFLPCNSHHIWDRNGQQQGGAEQRARTQATQSGAPAQNQATSTETSNANAPQMPPGFRAFTRFDPFTAFHAPLETEMVDEMHPNLRTFVREMYFNGAAVTEETTQQAVGIFMRQMQNFLNALPRQDDSDYDARGSIENLLRSAIPLAFNMILSESSANFGSRLLSFFDRFSDVLSRILLLCFGTQISSNYLNQISCMPPPNWSPAPGLRALSPLQMFHHQLIMRIQQNFELLDVNHVTANQVQPYLVIRARAPPGNAERTEVVPPRQSPDEPMETDEVVIEAPPQRSQTTMNVDAPPVEIEPQPWHRHFPRDWLPIMTQDVQKQRRQPEQLAFSDAYLTGMSSKRRKLIACSKPTSDVQEVLSEGVRQAIKATGLTSATQTSVDDVTRAIAADSNVQSSYQDEMKLRLRRQAENHPDYKADRFPNSSKYFK